MALLLGCLTPSAELPWPPADRAATSVAPAADAYRVVEVASAEFHVTQRRWIQLFASTGRPYVAAQLVPFRVAVDSGCGSSQAADGSFYCPLDRKVYVDLDVHLELQQRFPASAALAQAYILAHEIGHHVQALLDIEHGARPGIMQARFELQADCLAGISWHSATATRALERRDVEKAVLEAILIGEHVPSDASTHGSPAERIGSFRRGFESGQFSACEIRSAAHSGSSVTVSHRITPSVAFELVTRRKGPGVCGARA